MEIKLTNIIITHTQYLQFKIMYKGIQNKFQMTENAVRNYSNHGSEVLTIVTWDMTPCCPVEVLHLLG
jgi:hypothetical protein